MTNTSLNIQCNFLGLINSLLEIWCIAAIRLPRKWYMVEIVEICVEQIWNFYFRGKFYFLGAKFLVGGNYVWGSSLNLIMGPFWMNKGHFLVGCKYVWSKSEIFISGVNLIIGGNHVWPWGNSLIIILRQFSFLMGQLCMWELCFKGANFLFQGISLKIGCISKTFGVIKFKLRVKT